MRYTQLRAFDAVAREGGFALAAERIGLTQPALTIQVRALEDAYAVKLFRRGGGKATLTGPGRDLFQLTSELFAVEGRIKDYLSASKELKTGEIRLSIDGPHLAMGLIAAFRERYPGVQMAVSSGNAHEVWRDLMEGRADVVIVANPPKDQRAEVMAIHRCALQVLVGIDHPWAKRSALSISDLVAQPAILREPQSNTRRTLERILDDTNTRLDVMLELGGREAILEAVAAGLGIGFVFEREVTGNTRVKSIPLKGATHDNLDTVAALKSHRARRVVQAFFEIAKEWRDLNGGVSD